MSKSSTLGVGSDVHRHRKSPHVVLKISEDCFKPPKPLENMADFWLKYSKIEGMIIRLNKGWNSLCRQSIYLHPNMCLRQSIHQNITICFGKKQNHHPLFVFVHALISISKHWEFFLLLDVNLMTSSGVIKTPGAVPFCILKHKIVQSSIIDLTIWKL